MLGDTVKDNVIDKTRKTVKKLEDKFTGGASKPACRMRGW